MISEVCSKSKNSSDDSWYSICSLNGARVKFPALLLLQFIQITPNEICLDESILDGSAESAKLISQQRMTASDSIISQIVVELFRDVLVNQENIDEKIQNIVKIVTSITDVLSAFEFSSSRILILKIIAYLVKII